MAVSCQRRRTSFLWPLPVIHQPARWQDASITIGSADISPILKYKILTYLLSRTVSKLARGECLNLTLSLGGEPCQYRHKWYIAKNHILWPTFPPQKVSVGLYLQPFYVIRPKSTEFNEITQPLGLLRRSRWFKVTEFGTNRKLIYDFLLVINSNLCHMLHRFRDIAFDRSKIAIGYPSCV